MWSDTWPLSARAVMQKRQLSDRLCNPIPACCHVYSVAMPSGHITVSISHWIVVLAASWQFITLFIRLEIKSNAWHITPSQYLFHRNKNAEVLCKKNLSTPHDSIACRSTFTNNWKQTFSHLIWFSLPHFWRGILSHSSLQCCLNSMKFAVMHGFFKVPFL